MSDLIFVAAVFLGGVTQTVAGFGFMLCAITLSSLVMPVAEVVPLALPLSLMSASYVALQQRRVVARRLLWRQVLPVMAAGAAFGFVVAGELPATTLRRVLGAVVLLAVALGLARRGRAPAPWPMSARVAAVATAGVVQGMFGTGGPVLVLALERANLSAAAFRATLVTVWATLNGVLVLAMVAQGRYDGATALRVALAAPAVWAGVWLGERLHARLSPERFRMGVYGVLCAAALALLR